MSVKRSFFKDESIIRRLSDCYCDLNKINGFDKCLVEDFGNLFHDFFQSIGIDSELSGYSAHSITLSVHETILFDALCALMVNFSDKSIWAIEYEINTIIRQGGFQLLGKKIKLQSLPFAGEDNLYLCLSCMFGNRKNKKIFLVDLPSRLK